jgi:phage terminase large subunit
MAKTKEPKKEVRKIELHPQQYDAYYDEIHQFIACIAGVQSGKTFVGSYWARKMIYRFPEEDGLIISPTYKILASSTLRRFFSLFPQFRQYYKEQKGEIELPTGGIIYCRSADNPEGVAGLTCSWIWADEAGQMSDYTWEILRNRVAMTGGKVFLTSTPYNISNWFYTGIYLPWKEEKDKSIGVYTWKSTDNAKFSKEYFEAERMRLRPEAFARTYCGEFTRMTGLVYEIPPESIIDPKDIMSLANQIIIGVDFGYSDCAAIVVIYIVGNIFYIADEWKQSKRTNAEIIQVLKNKLTEHRATMIFPDSAEPDRAEEMRRAALPVYETVKDIEGGISFVQQLIREKRLLVFNNCKELIQEAEMYHYPEIKEGKEVKEVPVKVNDHLMDAMRYAIYSYKPMNPKNYEAIKPKGPIYYYPELEI